MTLLTSVLPAMRFRGLALLLFCLSFVAIGCDSDTGTGASNELGSISGSLSDLRNGKPIAGATVSLVGGDQTVTTDVSGGYSFTNVKAAGYKLLLKKENFGYGLTVDFNVAAGEKKVLNGALLPVMGNYNLKYSGYSGNVLLEGDGTLSIFDDLTWIFKEGGAQLGGTWTLHDEVIDIKDSDLRSPVYRFKRPILPEMGGQLSFDDSVSGT